MGTFNNIECVTFLSSESSSSLAGRLIRVSSVLDDLAELGGPKVVLFSMGGENTGNQYSIQQINEKLSHSGHQAQSFISARIAIFIGINEIDNIRFNFLYPDPIQDHNWIENKMWLTRALPIVRNGVDMGVFDFVHDKDYFGRSCALYIWLKIRQMHGPSAVIHRSSQGGKAARRKYSLLHRALTEVIESNLGEKIQVTESEIKRYVKSCDAIVGREFTRQEIKKILNEAQISAFKWFKKGLLF